MHRGRTATHTQLICSRTIVSEVLKLKSTYFNFIIDGLANYPSNVKDITRFLYYSLCLMKIFSKNALSCALRPIFERKRVQRYALFPNHQSFSYFFFKKISFRSKIHLSRANIIINIRACLSSIKGMLFIGRKRHVF